MLQPAWPVCAFADVVEKRPVIPLVMPSFNTMK